ncbi:MAG: helix-turn-helix transcriptional regulator [Actinomycetia bacterium]|nr:helix-turn-helix transcriptional regulator [Actinomycetes bacterium]
MGSELGQELRSVRLALGLSLKTAAGPAGISATYLQKLEAGEVKSPSPNVLHGLADTLNIPYTGLMELAGYVVPDTSERPANPFEHALSASDLTADERRAVAAFIAHLRDQREHDRDK